MKLPVKKIHTHPDLQARKKMNEEMIEMLTEVYREDPDRVDTINVFQHWDDGAYYILDGHHRFEAAKRAGLDEMDIYIQTRLSSFTDAVRLAIEANVQNPVPLGKDDIRRAVEILLKYDPKRSIEELCHILCRSKSTIYQYVKELSDAGKLTLPETRVGKDGKERTTKYAERAPKEEHDVQNSEPVPEEMADGTDAKTALEEDSAERDDIGCFAETARCGNGGCRRTCSPVYLSDLRKNPEEREHGDWVFGKLDPEKAYCSEECREYAEGQVLEKEADAILKASAPTDHDSADRDPDDKEILPCPVCGQMPNRCLDGSITCWGSKAGTQFPPHEIAIKTNSNFTPAQVREIWNRLAERRD